MFTTNLKLLVCSDMKLLNESKATYFYLIFTKICLIIVLQTINLVAFGQENEMGIPFAQNFPPKSYGYESQNFSITEDGEGIIYIGNLKWNLRIRL